MDLHVYSMLESVKAYMTIKTHEKSLNIHENDEIVELWSLIVRFTMYVIRIFVDTWMKICSINM